jgi:RHS repeat-associated protein
MNRIDYIETQLDDFKDSLTLYREQTRSWYAQALDQVSHAADLPSLLGMDRVIRFGDSRKVVGLQDRDFLSNVAQCPASGVLNIESLFESVHEIPLGDLLVDVIPVDGGPATPILLDAQGKGSFQGRPGQFYRVRVQGGVTSEQVDALFAAYADLTRDLETWLRREWSGFKPQWSSQTTSTALLAVGEGLASGSWEAIKGVWEGIELVLDILKDPLAYVDRLGSGAQELADLARRAPAVMEKALLLASDEAALFLLLRTAAIWLASLPPSQLAGDTAHVVASTLVSVLIDLLLGLVLTVAAAGAGVAYLALRLKKYGSQMVAAGTRFIQGLFSLLDGFMGYVGRYKAVAARGVAGAQKQGVLQMRWDGRKNATLRQSEHLDDVPRQAGNPNGQSAERADKTQTQGCPVSMVTGEELLTLVDGELDGPLPFSWSRLYRTSAVETRQGLGPGWSHGLAHSLRFDGDDVIWTDQENRSISFPRPTTQRPAIHNSLSEAAIYLGDTPDELILTQAGSTPWFYHFKYDRYGARLFSLSDRYGNRLSISHDIEGRIQRLDNGLGRALLLRYDRSRIVAVEYQQEQAGAYLAEGWQTLRTLVSYRYDDQGRLIEAANAVDECERYAYDEHHVIRERQLAGGAAFYWEWQGVGKRARCVRHWASFAQMDSRYTWDDNGSVTARHIDGSEEVFVHDERARLIRKVDADGAEQHKAYDAQGRLIAETDALGAITEYRYNEAGRLLAVIPPEDEPTFYEYHNGHLCRVQRGEANWKYAHNVQGDITRKTDPSGQVTEYEYDRRGLLNEIRHPDGSRHSLTWDRLGHLLEERLPDGSLLKYGYDEQGRQTSRQAADGAVTRYTWDAIGRLTQVEMPGGAKRRFSYNAYGKITAETDELGRVTRYEYADDLHQVSRRFNPDGSQLRYRYDNARLLLSEIENERGEHYRLDHYPNGLIREETGFDGRRTAYAYDLNGHLLEKKEFGDDGSELVTGYQRDSAGRLRLKSLADGQKIHYHYDGLGRLVSVDDGHWPLTYGYDSQDRLTSEHQGWATQRYRYDAVGQLIHCRLPDGNLIDYRYLPGGRLIGVDLNGRHLTRHRFEAGRERLRQQGQLLSHYRYDEQGRLLKHSLSQDNSGCYQRFYAYEANGNLASIDDSRHGLRRYQYDPLDRLNEVRGDPCERFVHDPAGNLLGDSPRMARTRGNRLLFRGHSHFDYDAFGNLIRERNGTEPQLVTEYRYDCQHRLTGVSLPDGGTVSYRYDAFGRRIAKTCAGLTTEYLWQGDRLIAESGPAHYRSYLYEPDSFRPLALLNGEGPEQVEAFHYQLDHLGTPQELTDEAGNIRWAARYYAYGRVAHLDRADIDNPLRFQGQYFDTETGLHYNRHRYYNPETGRYLTPDPIKLAGGLNSYQYAPNPTGWVDPLGLNRNCPGNKTTQDTGKKCEPDPPEVSRNGAFREAKSDAGIPRSQHPNQIYDPETGQYAQYKYKRMTDSANNPILDDKGKPIMSREYEFTRTNGSKIIIQDHSAGHNFGAPDGVGDQKAHLNVRPYDLSRTGKVEGTKPHYNFKDKK